MRTFLLVLSLLFSFCLFAADYNQHQKYFDETWMRVQEIDEPALPYICQRPDKVGKTLYGCAKRHNDAGYVSGERGRGTCMIYISRTWVARPAVYQEIVEHEARHCVDPSWRHPGD